MAEESELCGSETQDESFASTSASAHKAVRLQVENAELKKQNKDLREQLGRALALSAQVEACQTKYQAVASELRELKSERDDMGHRLEILLQTNKELTKKLQEEQQSRNSQAALSASTLARELERLRAQAATEIEAAAAELEKVKQSYEKVSTQHKIVSGRVERLLQSAQRTVSAQLPSLDALIELFDSGRLGDRSVTALEQKASTVENAELERRVRKLKAKVFRLRSEKKEADAATQDLQQELQATKLTARQHELEASAKAAQWQNEATDAARAAEQLKSKAEALRAENARLRAGAGPPPGSKGGAVARKPQETAGNRSRLSERVSDLAIELESSRAKQDRLERSLKAAEGANADLQLQLKKQKTENDALQTSADEAQAQANSLRSALQARASEAAQRGLAEAAAPSSKKAKKELAYARREIAKLEDLESQQKQQLEQTLAELRELKYAKEQLEAELEEAKFQLRELHAKSEVAKAVPATAPFPLDSFANIGLDADAAAAVQKIAANPVWPLPSKFQASLKTIVSTYTRRLQETETKLATADRDNQTLLSNYSQFTLDLSIALTDKSLPSDNIFSKKVAERIVATAAELRQTADDLKHECATLKAVTDHFAQAFEINDSDFIKAIDEIKRIAYDQYSLAAQKSKAAKVLKRENGQLARMLAASNSDKSARFDELTQKVDSLSRENEKLQAELADARRALRRAESAPVCSKQERGACAVDSTALQRELADVRRRYDQLLEQTTAEQERLRQTNHRQSLEIAQLEQQLNEKSTALSQQFEAEKSASQAAHDSTITDLRRELAQQRSESERISSALQETIGKCQALEALNEKLAKKKQKAAHGAATLKLSIAKEKKLAELSAVAHRVSLEGEFNKRVDELKTKTEADKRRLYALGAEAFRGFFDATAEIDERSFRQMVGRAREELERLSASDRVVRRLVNASEGQTTEDAVAQIVIDTA
jgi:chromosome segregation ATPase